MGGVRLECVEEMGVGAGEERFRGEIGGKIVGRVWRGSWNWGGVGSRRNG